MVITFFPSSVREGHVVIQFSQFTLAFIAYIYKALNPGVDL